MRSVPPDFGAPASAAPLASRATDAAAPMPITRGLGKPISASRPAPSFVLSEGAEPVATGFEPTTFPIGGQSHRQVAAVDGHLDAGDVGGLVGGEEQVGVGHLLDAPLAPHRD